MSTFRRIDSLLDGKTSDQLAREIAARERRLEHTKTSTVTGNDQIRPLPESLHGNRTLRTDGHRAADRTRRVHRMSQDHTALSILQQLFRVL